MSDIYPISGRPFVHAYPIANRLVTPGLWMSWSIGEGKVWPVENDPNVGDEFGQRQIWCYYADDHPDIPGPFEEHVGPGVYYDEDWDSIQLFSELDPRMHANGQYLYAPTWMHYDIPQDVAIRIERAEFVCNIGTYHDRYPDDLPFLVQIRSGITDYKGWRPSPHDFQTMQGASVCPPLSSSEVFANGEADEHRFSDPYIDRDEWGSYSPRHVLPINAAGLEQIRRGGRVGIMAGLDGSTAPADMNFMWMECQYTSWDSDLETSGPHYAGFLLPTLRLWIGGELLVAGESTITMTATGDIRNPPVPLLTHKARAIRDRR